MLSESKSSKGSDFDVLFKICHVLLISNPLQVIWTS